MSFHEKENIINQFDVKMKYILYWFHGKIENGLNLEFSRKNDNIVAKKIISYLNFDLTNFLEIC